MEIKIAKFELYPKEEPTGYAVGFNVTTTNGRSFYTDTPISFDEIPTDSTDEEIIQIGYDKLKDGITSRVQQLEAKGNIIGSTFSPLE